MTRVAPLVFIFPWSGFSFTKLPDPKCLWASSFSHWRLWLCSLVSHWYCLPNAIFSFLRWVRFNRRWWVALSEWKGHWLYWWARIFCFFLRSHSAHFERNFLSQKKNRLLKRYRFNVDTTVILLLRSFGGSSFNVFFLIDLKKIGLKIVIMSNNLYFLKWKNWFCNR